MECATEKKSFLTLNLYVQVLFASSLFVNQMLKHTRDELCGVTFCVTCALVRVYYGLQTNNAEAAMRHLYTNVRGNSTMWDWLDEITVSFQQNYTVNFCFSRGRNVCTVHSAGLWAVFRSAFGESDKGIFQKVSAFFLFLKRNILVQYNALNL